MEIVREAVVDAFRRGLPITLAVYGGFRGAKKSDSFKHVAAGAFIGYGVGLELSDAPSLVDSLGYCQHERLPPYIAALNASTMFTW